MIQKLAIIVFSAAFLQGTVYAAEPASDTGKPAAVEKKTKKKGKITFEGGDGSSMEKAIIILGAKDSGEGVPAESAYIKKHFRGYEKKMQGLLSKDGKYYDQITLEKGNKKIVLYFDITDFFGKNNQ